jgi:alpha-galactosidase
MKTLSTFEIVDTTIRYVTDDTGHVGLTLFPSSMTGDLVEPRATLRGMPEIDALPGNFAPPARPVESLAHVKIAGDPYPGAFAQGRTMHGSPSVDRFKLDAQRVEKAAGDRTTIITALRAADGCRIEHRLSSHAGDPGVEITTTFINGSPVPVTLELLTSFALGNITPFHEADAPGRLRVHRFRSVWSAEGRLDTQTVEQLHLERSWSGAGLFSERFGQVGTMPVRGWFPIVAAEDTAAGVTWAAQLAWPGSWQMEITRQHDDLCISGGLVDREFGHWINKLAAGESITSPPATLVCVRGGLDEACDRLTSLQTRAADSHPAIERGLPIVFNEWCTTWGDPRHERVVAIADRLRGSEVKYLVIDAGWYKTDGGDWGNGHGDWIPNTGLFPQGLAATAAAIRQRGLIPGLWFEMETVGDASAVFSLVDHLLKRDGIPVTVRNRRFWDLNDPFAVDYLTDRVIGTLRDGGFGYLKVDYNETLGLGCDSGESLGEGLRRQAIGIHRFFDRIRDRLPELVIESCSSGGHRLEPSMIGRSAMSSFSDAHELVEIPIIAANLHRLMLPRQSQIWAVLHKSDSDRRLIYSLAATFLGRMCLSGEIDQLSQAQMDLVLAAERVYRQAAPIIREGTSRRFGQLGESWRHPTGWQGVVRTARDGNAVLLVLHAFADAPAVAEVPLPARKWEVAETFPLSSPDIAVNETIATWRPAPFSAVVAILERR